MKNWHVYLLLFFSVALSQQRVLFAAPRALHADDIKATIAACGKPTRQNAISGDSSGTSWILYYQSKGIDLIYNKVDGQWLWRFADDHQRTVLFSDGQLLDRLPCMEKIVAASNQRAQAAPPAATTSTPVDTVPAGSGSSENNSQSNVGFWTFIGVLILLIIGVGAARGWSNSPQGPVPDVPIKCPKCGSTQVHAGARGFKLTTGFIGSGKVLLTCLRCGRQFKPGYGG